MNSTQSDTTHVVQENMNILSLFRASSGRPGGLPCVTLTRPGTDEVTSLVGATRRIYTLQPGPDQLVVAPTLTPGQRYSEHPAGVLLACGLTLHAERLARMLEPDRPFCLRDALRWAGLDDADDTATAARLGGRWYPLETVQNSENLSEIRLNAAQKRYTLLKQIREDVTVWWTLDFTMLHDLHADQEPACSDDPPSPPQRTNPTYTSR